MNTGKRKVWLPGMLLICAASVTLLPACAGRDPEPVAQYLPGDDAKSCEDIRIEQAAINAEVARLRHDEDKTGKNVALGAAGLVTFGVSWLWMDFSDAERVEINAYRARFLALEHLATDHGCARHPWVDAGGLQSDLPLEERLRRLDALHEEGLVSDEEYQTLRARMLEEL